MMHKPPHAIYSLSLSLCSFLTQNVRATDMKLCGCFLLRCFDFCADAQFRGSAMLRYSAHQRCLCACILRLTTVATQMPPSNMSSAHTTPRRFYREILKNTLSDTPSGYLQDPRAAPTQMVNYNRLSETSEAALEALRQEEEMQSREVLAYQGYTSSNTDEAKNRLLEADISPAALRDIAAIFEGELETVLTLVGHTVRKPLTENQRQLRLWRRERERLEALERNAFIAEFNGGRPAAVDENAHVEVVIDPVDGTEHVVHRAVNPSQKRAARARFVAKDDQGNPLRAEDQGPGAITTEDVQLQTQPASFESEAANEELLDSTEEVEVTREDVHHLRYLLALTYQRVGAYEAMEKQLLAILAENPHSVDAIQSLLEVYTGLDTTSKIGDLIEFVTQVEAKIELAGGAEVARPELDRTPTVREAACEGGDITPPSEMDETNLSVLPTTEETSQARLTAPEIVIALLAEQLTETAALYCRDHGEGATSRFFLQALGPIAKRIGPQHTAFLLEALFRSFDAQHFVARAEADDPSLAASRELIFSVVIAFLKTLVSRGMSELVRDPVHFEFFTLSKLYAALRSASGGSRRQESFRVCERMLTLYRTNSSLHAARLKKSSQPTSPSHAASSVSAATISQPATTPTLSTSVSPSSCDTVPATTGGGALDDQDDNYRAAYLQYVRDRAKDTSPAIGRALCLAAMEEFPDAAEPWEVLALILHREDPKGKLKDAILAAQRARELEPLNLGVLLTLANLYKADNRRVLYETMLDRFKLLSFMVENGASAEDMSATLEEIAEMDVTIPQESELDLVEETSRPMKEFNERYEMHTTYSMPINKEVRKFGEQPVKMPAHIAGMPLELVRGAPSSSD